MSEHLKPTAQLVLDLLQARYPDGVSAIELDREHGIYRAGARVFELRALGYAIEMERRPGETAVYRLTRREAFDGTLGLERTA